MNTNSNEQQQKKEENKMNLTLKESRPTYAEIADAIYQAMYCVPLERAENPIALQAIKHLAAIQLFTTEEIPVLDPEKLKESELYTLYDKYFPLDTTQFPLYTEFEKLFDATRAAKTTYKQSAQGIVDALADHNILQQQLALENVSALQSPEFEKILKLMEQQNN